MSKSIPVRFLRETTLLLDVPQSEFLDTPKCDDPLDHSSRLNFFKLLRSKTRAQPKTPPVNPKQKQIRQFHTAAWLSFRNPPNKPVALLLAYQDSKGEFALVVDERTPDSSPTMMLSGDTQIEFYGELQYVRAIATGLKKEHQFYIEDVHVQRIRPKKPNTDKEDYWLVSSE